jgi:hypothetical protein
MIRFHESDALGTLSLLSTLRLVNACERAFVHSALSEPLLGTCLERAETIHLHVKVDDTARLAHDVLVGAGAELDHALAGFVKYRLPGGINAIFSHIPVAAEDLRESSGLRRARPFIDHLGIDVRVEDDVSRAAFDALPREARRLGWECVRQGGAGSPVRCCHVEVAEKHWLFPTAAIARPIEVAFGPLRRSSGVPGCDLRPAHPAMRGVACCSG